MKAFSVKMPLEFIPTASKKPLCTLTAESSLLPVKYADCNRVSKNLRVMWTLSISIVDYLPSLPYKVYSLQTVNLFCLLLVLCFHWWQIYLNHVGSRNLICNAGPTGYWPSEDFWRPLGPFLLHLLGSDVGRPSLLDIPPSPEQAPEHWDNKLHSLWWKGQQLFNLLVR